jgi:hypothetical protein
MKKLTRARKLKVTKFPYREFASHGGITYFEDENMNWSKHSYDEYGQLTYIEESSGYWSKREYDYAKREIRSTSSDGDWSLSIFDTNCKTIYYEQSNGYVVENGVEKMKCKVTGELKILKH